MVLLTTPIKAQKQLAENARLRRLQLELTQAGLAKRAGVALPSVRKFEQKGLISLASFLKLYMVLGGLEKLVEATETERVPFASMDDLLKAGSKPGRKRGKRQ